MLPELLALGPYFCFSTTSELTLVNFSESLVAEDWVAYCPAFLEFCCYGLLYFCACLLPEGKLWFFFLIFLKLVP